MTQTHEQLGIVTSPSGTLIIIDTGYLGIWSHDKAPILTDDYLSGEERAIDPNSFVDLEIVGADSEKAGRLLEMSWHPHFIYDQDPNHTELSEKFTRLVNQHRLDARLQTLSARVPHLQRAEQALKYGQGAGEFQFHGVWAVAIAGEPISQPLRILGERMPLPNFDCWRRVIIECNRGQVTRSENIGVVGVDYARFLVSDLYALNAWQHEESLDGLADFVFWGGDAERLARALDAPQLDSSEFGWVDVPKEFALEKGRAAINYISAEELRVATDYRPHSHHWRVMEPSRKTTTGSGTTEVGGATVCNFTSTWGNGAFDVFRDLSDTGKLVQIRIEFLHDEPS